MAAAVSVIVPAHNVAPYIGRCLESLFQQTVPLEIVVVNDGSTDETAAVARALTPPARHSLVVIDQANRGPGVARNAGLSRSRCEYVGFVDGDDWVGDEMFAVLTAEAARQAAELVICGGRMIHHVSGDWKPFMDTERLATLTVQHPGPLNPRDVPDLFLLDASPCKRLYRRSLLEQTGLSFAEGLLFEDVPVHYQLLLASTKVVLVDRNFYFYRIGHPGRITDRQDQLVLTVFDVMRRVQATLRAASASHAIWARFAWFQSWVLRWLCRQVDPQYTEAFVTAAVMNARSIPLRGIQEFQRVFGGDQVAQRTVALQRLGWTGTYLRMAKNLLGERDQSRLAVLDRLNGLSAYVGSWT